MPDLRSGLDPVDYRFINNKPDPDFSPERNKAIVDETIKETDKFFAQEGKIMDKALGERIDIISSYALYRFNKGTKSFLNYFGKENYHKLIGEKILSKVRIAETVNKLNG